MTKLVLVYSDIRKYMMRYRRHNRADVLTNLTKCIENYFDGEIWFPSFNYNCLQTGVFRYESDPSQVGLLSEYNRSNSYTRSIQPVFNIVSNFDRLKIETPENAFSTSPINLFGASYFFRELVERNGLIVWLGLPFEKLATLTHMAEVDSGGVCYRADKAFNIKVLFPGNESYDVRAIYNVRPRLEKIRVDYDVDLRKKITAELESFSEFELLGIRAYSVSARELYFAYLNIIKNNQFGLLTADSVINYNNYFSELENQPDPWV